VFKAACAGYCVAVDAAAHTTVLLLTPKSPGRKPSKRSELTSSPVFVCVCGDHGAHLLLKSTVAASILESFIPKAKFEWVLGFVVLRGLETLMMLGRWGDDAGLRMGRVSHGTVFGRT
jgi:hypothetical protein